MYINIINKNHLVFRLFCIVLFGLCACSTPVKKCDNSGFKDTIVVKDYNIVIAPDLSNRIDSRVHPKPLHDSILINGIIDEIGSILTLQNRRVGQKDIFSLDFINPGILNNSTIAVASCRIDFGHFSNLYESAEYKRIGLSRDQELFKQEVAKVYEHAHQNLAGADIWNYFNQTIHNQVKILPPESYVEGCTTISRQFRNVAVLFTDGYIENAGGKKDHQFSEGRVEYIRKAFNASKSKALQSYIDENFSLGIASTIQSLKDWDVILFEIVDRSLDSNGVAIKSPTDFEILSVIWKSWLKQSGCKHVEVYKAVADKKILFDRLGNFLKVI